MKTAAAHSDVGMNCCFSLLMLYNVYNKVHAMLQEPLACD